MKAVLLATIAVAVKAACPNSCSGHGTCNHFDQCDCYDEVGRDDPSTKHYNMYTGADCSQYTCPRGTSWTQRLTASTNQHLVNIECSDAGLCNRATGECTCFPGYEGSACQRTSCPNDCSGHGTCRSNQDFALDFSEAVTNQQAENAELDSSFKNVVYYKYFKVQYEGAWDAGMQYGCLCDQGFRGPDCSLIECPSDQDPMAKETCKKYDEFITAGTAYGDNDKAGDAGNTMLWTEYGQKKNAVPYYAPIKEYPCNGAPAGLSCSGRGTCDYSTGVCACFQGFTGTACEEVQQMS